MTNKEMVLKQYEDFSTQLIGSLVTLMKLKDYQSVIDICEELDLKDLVKKVEEIRVISADYRKKSEISFKDKILQEIEQSNQEDDLRQEARRKAQIESDAKTAVEAKVKTKVKAKAETKVEPEAISKVEPEETKVEPEAIPKVEPEETKVEPEAIPKVEPEDKTEVTLEDYEKAKAASKVALANAKSLDFTDEAASILKEAYEKESTIRQRLGIASEFETLKPKIHFVDKINKWIDNSKR